MKYFGYLAAAAIGMTATAALAQDFKSPLKARQGQMQIMAMNLGMLGKMAKGEMDFDATQAQLAADTLVAVSHIQQGPMWPQGSDNGAIEGTGALPAIWEKPADFAEDWEDFGKGALTIQAAVADGQAALGPAMGVIGKTCGACHETFRVKQN
jgi:cytochrome c556